YKDDSEKKYLAHLKRYCKKIYLSRRPKKPWQINNIFKAIFSPLPFLIVRNFSQEAKTIIAELLKSENFDAIHAETFYIMPHIPDTKVPIILVEQTIEYKVYQHFVNSLPWYVRFLFYLDIVKLMRSERFYWRKANIVATVSQSDEKIIKELEPKIKTTIVPNGAGEEMITKNLTSKNLKKPFIIFQGNFNWLQNVEAARYLTHDIAPKLMSVLRNVQIVISGQNAHKIAEFKKKGLTIVDIKPDDFQTVQSLFRKATLFIAPIFGPGGTRLKILAAMASGIPVISTKIGVEGLEVEDKKHVIIADGAQEFVKKILAILSHRSQYEMIRKNAFNLVKERYNWQTIAQTLEMVYQTIIES
ncbi:glycosyltransferase family 4 protein, partial [Candidatus Roizmanbacteria bacterium]|nr:glycosyltransferase family 4 protein [Candidatus Roizmanbacteria bacterium]